MSQENMELQRIYELVARKHDVGLDASESRELEAFQRDAEIAGMIRQLDLLYESSLPVSQVPVDTDEAWKRFQAGKRNIHQTSPRLFTLLKYAAVLLICSGIGWWFWQRSGTPQPVTAKAGMERLHVSLPDGSLAILAPGAELRYQQDWEQEARDLTLRGKAYFSVQPREDQPFRVSTPAGSVRVLGTKFTVVQKGENLAVGVESGKVEVAIRQIQQVYTLHQGDELIFRDSLHLHHAGYSNLNAWVSGQLVFRNENMKEVLGTLEDYFSVQVECQDPSFLSCSFTGTFRNPLLEQDILPVLEKALGCRFTKLGDGRYQVSGSACQ